MRKIVALVLFIVLVAGVFVGCNSGGGGEAPAPAPAQTTEGGNDQVETPSGEMQKIGFIPYYRRDDFYKDLENAAYRKCAELGYELIVMDPDGDTAKQVQMIEDLCSMGADAITLSPFIGDALVPLIKSKDVPFITFDGKVDNDEGVVACAVQFDFFACGTALGEMIEEYVTENGQYDGSKKLRTAIIDFPASTNTGVPIIDKCVEYLEGKGMIEVISRQDGKADRNTAMGVMENILTGANNDVDLLIGFNYDACMGGVEAAYARGLEGKMIAFSQMWGEEAFLQLENNDPIYKGGVAYSPVEFGYGAINAADGALKGTLESNEWWCEPYLFTSKNISSFDWRAIIEARNN